MSVTNRAADTGVWLLSHPRTYAGLVVAGIVNLYLHRRRQ
jgi:hypothetical protein